MQDLVDPSQYLQLFPAAFAPKKSEFDLASLSTLYDSVDFIGISAYPSLKPNFTLSQIESATQQFDLEIQQFGINIKELLFSKASLLHVATLWRGRPFCRPNESTRPGLKLNAGCTDEGSSGMEIAPAGQGAVVE